MVQAYCYMRGSDFDYNPSFVICSRQVANPLGVKNHYRAGIFIFQKDLFSKADELIGFNPDLTHLSHFLGGELGGI